MNRFKAWLIRKLGGYVYLTEKVTYKTLHHDDNFNCDRLRYVLRVVEPPKN